MSLWAKHPRTTARRGGSFRAADVEPMRLCDESLNSSYLQTATTERNEF